MAKTSDMLGNFFDGDITDDDREVLAQALEGDPDACREFDSAVNLEALLTAAHSPAPDYARIINSIASVSSRAQSLSPGRILSFPSRSTQNRPRAWLLAAAAALALIAGGTLLLRTTGNPVLHEVVSGMVLVDGAEASEVRDGQRLEVIGDCPAVLNMNDGSRATLAPSSVALVRGREGSVRQNLTLVAGRGDFEVQPGSRLFKVTTSVGNVTVLGTEFSVELRRIQQQGGEEMRGRIAAAMVVAVTLGSVEVEVDGKAYVLSAGQTRTWAEEEARAPKTKRVSGTVQSHNGNSLTILQTGDSGEKQHTFGLGSNVKILVETDQWEDKTGEGGRTEKRRVIAEGVPADLTEGKQVTVTVTQGDGKAVNITVRAARQKREGGEGDGKREGGEKKERRSEGEGEDNG